MTKSATASVLLTVLIHSLWLTNFGMTEAKLPTVRVAHDREAVSQLLPQVDVLAALEFPGRRPSQR